MIKYRKSWCSLESEFTGSPDFSSLRHRNEWNLETSIFPSNVDLCSMFHRTRRRQAPTRAFSLLIKPFSSFTKILLSLYDKYIFIQDLCYPIDSSNVECCRVPAWRRRVRMRGARCTWWGTLSTSAGSGRPTAGSTPARSPTRWAPQPPTRSWSLWQVSRFSSTSSFCKICFELLKSRWMECVQGLLHAYYDYFVCTLYFT